MNIKCIEERRFPAHRAVQHICFKLSEIDDKVHHDDNGHGKTSSSIQDKHLSKSYLIKSTKKASRERSLNE